MGPGERLWFLDFADGMAEELATLIRTEARVLADTEEDAVEGLWKVWDSVLQMERKHRAEWVRSELESDRVNAEARAAHPDDYEQWLDDRNQEIRDIILRRVQPWNDP